MSNAALEAQVKAVNEANAYAEKLSKTMRDAFAKFVGQKIFTVNGKLMKKCTVVLPCHASNININVYFHHSAYSLTWCVKTCEQVVGTEGCLYHSVTVYVGDIDNCVLTELCEPFTGRSDYTVGEILRKREVYFAAEKVYCDARSDLFPFGEN